MRCFRLSSAFRSIIAGAAIAILPAVAANAKAMTFAFESNGGNCNDCEFIIADGDIERDTVDRFREDGGPGIVYLNSSGGDLLGALMLGEEFRRIGVHTIVQAFAKRTDGSLDPKAPIDGVCTSACAYAFLGGQERTVPDGSRLGMHSFASEAAPGAGNIYSAADITNAQILTGLLVQFVQNAGADPIIVKIASEIDQADMHFFSPDEVRQYRINASPLLLQNWQLEPYRDGLVMAASSVDKTVTVTMFCNASGLKIMLTEAKTLGERGANQRNVVTAEEAIDLTYYNESIGFADSPSQLREDAKNEYRTSSVSQELERFLLSPGRVRLSYGLIRAEIEAPRAIVDTAGLPTFLPVLKRNCI